MSLFSKIRNTATLMLGHGIEISQETWDREYERGDNDYYHSLDQLARYSVLAGYVRRLRPRARVLDVGCGDGILQQALAPDGYAEYVGLDLSEPALAAARQRSDPHTTFVQCDAARWEPSSAFDIIVFNEAIYYFRDPVAVLQRYERALGPDGLFTVSMYWRAGNTLRIWKNIARVYPCWHETRLRSGPGGAWVIRVLGRPGTGPDALRSKTAQ